MDFTDLNKVCSKDNFPLPRIDALVDSTSRYKLLNFMDAFSGYNQILMHPEDQEKTAFITDRGLYCYKVMPFGLKNVGATNQQLVDKMFQGQIGRNLEVYVDDVVSFKLLASARVICNIVCVQVRGRIHRELHHENQFLSKLILL